MTTRRVLGGLRDIGFRDDVLRRCTDVHDDALPRVLQELSRLAPPELAAPPYTLLAAAVYLRGNGALAGMALERALAVEPDYSLARLLDEALMRQVPPSVLRRAWRTA